MIAVLGCACYLTIGFFLLMTAVYQLQANIINAIQTKKCNANDVTASSFWIALLAVYIAAGALVM